MPDGAWCWQRLPQYVGKAVSREMAKRQKHRELWEQERLKVSQLKYERGALVRLLWFGKKELVTPAARAKHEEREQQNKEKEGPLFVSTLTIGMLHTDENKLQLVEPGSVPEGTPLSTLRKV